MVIVVCCVAGKGAVLACGIVEIEMRLGDSNKLRGLHGNYERGKCDVSHCC
jgi:hypothetical protein